MSFIKGMKNAYRIAVRNPNGRNRFGSRNIKIKPWANSVLRSANSFI
jgi:hypothetical protein